MTTQESLLESESLIVADFQQSLAYLDKAVANFDPRYTLRVLRGLPTVRRQLNSRILNKIVQLSYPEKVATASEKVGAHDLSYFIKEASKHEDLSANDKASNAKSGADKMDVDDAPAAATADAVEEVKSEKQPVVLAERTTPMLPEFDMYLHLLVQVWILDTAPLDLFVKYNEYCVERLGKYNERSMDYIAAKIYFYYARGGELTGKWEPVREKLMLALRTASLHYDSETQASLICLLLRNYLACSQISQAANLIAKAPFPESASNALAARHFYYLARVYAVQLAYTTAHDKITAAIRMAPQTGRALGFLQAAQKLSIVIELLMGDIPERTIFLQEGLEASLEPYFYICRSVRIGNIALFTETVAKYADRLKKDSTYSLVLRLRQNVIKTGIRTMSLTYSKISLRDICIRLHLDSEESAEYIVAKAIRDGVIEAEIDHERGFMKSREVSDTYSTAEPQTEFHDRIKFCIQLHDESVKAMRYLMNAHRDDLKNAQEAREREKELVSEIQDGGSDIDDDDGDFDI